MSAKKGRRKIILQTKKKYVETFGILFVGSAKYVCVGGGRCLEPRLDMYRC